MVLRPLKGFGAFESAVRTGRRVTVGPLSLTVGKSTIVRGSGSDSGSGSGGLDDTILYGVSVPKRIAKSAVVRNRIKRLLRVSLRRVLTDYEEQCRVAGITTIVTIWRDAPDSASLIRLHDVLPVVEKAVIKGIQRISQQSGPT